MQRLKPWQAGRLAKFTSRRSEAVPAGNSAACGPYRSAPFHPLACYNRVMTAQSTRLPQCLCLATIATCLLGCGADSNLAPVQGVVRLDGQPVTQGTVRFVPAAGRGAKGTIQPDGSFTLGTYTDTDGASIGKHRVAIISYEVDKVERTDGGRPMITGSTPLVPRRYMAPGTSGLEFEVERGQNEAVFDLESE